MGFNLQIEIASYKKHIDDIAMFHCYLWKTFTTENTVRISLASTLTGTYGQRPTSGQKME